MSADSGKTLPWQVNFMSATKVPGEVLRAPCNLFVFNGIFWPIEKPPGQQPQWPLLNELANLPNSRSRRTDASMVFRIIYSGQTEDLRRRSWLNALTSPLN